MSDRRILRMDLGSSIWQSLTTLGEVGFALALAPILLLAVHPPRARLLPWLRALCIGALLVLATKLAYMGWHIGVPAIAFTGISGHAYLAAALLPFWLALLLPPRHGLVLGLALAAAVAVSRVALGAHSMSEAALGWLLGSVVSLAGMPADGDEAGPLLAAERLLWVPALLVLLALWRPALFHWADPYRLELGLAHWLSR